jgi:GntR family transcriptional repressor for pyruvate dehydrogenase complex
MQDELGDAPPRTFGKIPQSLAYQQVFSAIEKAIESGRLAIGDSLPSETDLAEQFGVNRSTVREGLRLLEHAGMVRRDGKRLIIALPRYLDLAARASRALAMHRVTFLELWEASMSIEPLIASLAAQRVTAVQLAAFDKNLAQMGEHIEDTGRVPELDVAFHNLLAEAAGNRALILAREPIGLLFRPAGEVILPRLKTQNRILEAHRFVVDLLKKQDAPGAEDWMRRHMADFKRGYEATGMDPTEPLDP